MLRTRREIARESRSFPYFHTALKACALRLDGTQPFDSGQSAFVLESDQLGQVVGFEMYLDANLESLARQSSVSPSAVQLSIILQDEDTKQHRILASWGHSDMPSIWQGSIPPSEMGDRQVMVAVVVHLNQSLARSLDSAWREGSILAQRAFALAFQGYASLFRVSWESFKDRGWEPSALWHVDFRISEAFDESIPEEAVLVYTNRDLPALNYITSTSALRHPKIGLLAKLVLRFIAAMAIADIVVPVLLDIARRIESGELRGDDIDVDSLSGRVLSTLREGNLSQDEALRLARELPAELRERIQGMLKLGASLDYSALTRLREQ
jgi:hypothetical protein